MSHLLPITRRGLFGEDDFFASFRPSYSSAVEDVMDRWGGRSLLADRFSNYRNARREVASKSPEPDDDSVLPATISDNPDSYVIVLDMSDYISGEISVRTRGQNAVLEAKSPGGSALHRRYPLPPDASTEGLVAAMSDDGILTISAKRGKNVKAKSSNQTPVQSSTPLNNLSSLASNLKIEIGLDDDLNIPVETDQSAIKNNVNRTSSIDEVEIACPITRKGDFFKDSYFESVWKDFDNAMGDMVDRQKGRKEKREQATREKELSRKQVWDDMLREEDEKMGRMREDRMQRRKMRDEQMQDTMNSFRMQAGFGSFQRPSFDGLRSYDRLREWSGSAKDSQAVQVTSDDKEYKVVMDMKDFKESELDVKCEGDVLMVRGGGAGNSLSRQFELPGLGDPEKVTAALSEDGVLTITAPRK